MKIPQTTVTHSTTNNSTTGVSLAIIKSFYHLTKSPITALTSFSLNNLIQLSLLPLTTALTSNAFTLTNKSFGVSDKMERFFFAIFVRYTNPQIFLKNCGGLLAPLPFFPIWGIPPVIHRRDCDTSLLVTNKKSERWGGMFGG